MDDVGVEAGTVQKCPVPKHNVADDVILKGAIGREVGAQKIFHQLLSSTRMDGELDEQ